MKKEVIKGVVLEEQEGRRTIHRAKIGVALIEFPSLLSESCLSNVFLTVCKGNI